MLIALLFVSVVVVIGVISWFKWSKLESNEAKTITNNLNQSARPARSSNIPAGYTEYKNQEFSLKFIYPSEWGGVTTSPDFEMKEGHLSAGKGIELSFSQNKNIVAAVRSKDWTHNPNIGHGGADNVLYLSPDKPYNPANNQRQNYKVYFNDKNGYFALTPVCGEDATCSYMGLVLIKNLPNNPNTNGISLLYTAPTTINLNLAEGATSQKDIDALPWAENFPNSLVEQFKVINSSISNL
ncbi:MAG TPA: hypothetical protein PLF57_00735 [Candidatus Saccharibacteria bacterium]|nr:hypothetical protein [Candidatus Saccharibacteria bacterium]HPW48199.1 hypothetical protein [Candidatus Saccharibacteria bacterium]